MTVERRDLVLLDLPRGAVAELADGETAARNGEQPVQVVDLRGELSDRDSRDLVERILARRSLRVVEWSALEDLVVEPQGWVDEALDWLADRPFGDDERGGLAGALTYRGRISLWWLTKVSQRKRAKTPFATHVMLAHRASAALERGPTGDVTSRAETIWVVSGAPVRARTLLESTRASLDRRNGAVSIRTVILGDADETNGSDGAGAGPLSGLLTALSQFFRLLRSLFRTYSNLLTDHLWLRHLHRESEACDRPGGQVVLVSLDRGDFSVNESSGTWTNQYLPDVPRKLEAADFGTCWLALDENELMDRSIYSTTRSALGNDYAPLYPGWRVLVALLLANFRWLAAYPWHFLGTGFEERWSYRGARLGRLVRADYEELLAGHAARLLYHRACFAAYFRRMRPRAVLYLKAFNSIGRIITSAAPDGALMAGVQHGIVNREQIGYLYRSGEIDPRPAAEADHVDHCPAPDVLLAFGQRMVDFMSGAGFPADRVRPIGSLRHDRVVSDHLLEGIPNSQDRTVAGRREALDLPPDRPVVLLCLQWARTTGRWFELLVRARERMPVSPHLACKPHPLEAGSEARISAAAEAGEVGAFSVLRGQIYPMILASDVMVTHSSTAVLDALLLETPVALIEETGLPNDNALYREGGAVWSARTDEQMAEVLTEIVQSEYDSESWHERRRAFLRYNLHNEDAGAIDRLIGLLEAHSTEEHP